MCHSLGNLNQLILRLLVNSLCAAPDGVNHHEPFLSKRQTALLLFESDWRHLVLVGVASLLAIDAIITDVFLCVVG